MAVPAQMTGTPAPAAGAGSTPPDDQRSLAPNTDTNGTTSSPASVETSQGAVKEPDIFRNLFNHMRGIPVETGEVTQAKPSGAEKESEGAEKVDPAKVQTSAEGTGADNKSSGADAKGPRPLVFDSQDALDRHIQSEVDRRAAKRARDERIAREAAEEARLLETNPYEYAQRVKQKQETAQTEAQKAAELVSFASQQIDQYDDLVLSPMFRRLPAQERDAILSAIEPGLPGRGKAADAALQTLERVYTQKGVESARKTLLEDPAFIKEVFARYGGQNFEVEPVESAGASAQPTNMNDVLRSMGGPILQRRRGF